MKHYTVNDADSVKEITQRINLFFSQVDSKVTEKSELVN
jgi:hypothetical protein